MAFKAGKCAEPPRMAQVTIMFSACDEPFLEDYLVGPLPVSENTTAVPYSFRTTKGTSRITNYDADADKTQEFIVATAQTCDDIITDLLGAPADSWDIWGIDPLWHEDGRVISAPAFLHAFTSFRADPACLHGTDWVGFWGIPETVFDGETLLPQGLYMKFDVTGRDPSQWSFLG